MGLFSQFLVPAFFGGRREWPAPGIEQLFDLEPDAVGNGPASADFRMRHMPRNALLACGEERHAMVSMPLPIQGHQRQAIALTMFSVTFLASPSNIMVLSR